MAAHLFAALSDGLPSEKEVKQVGCMKAFFHVFDQQQSLSRKQGSSPKKIDSAVSSISSNHKSALHRVRHSWAQVDGDSNPSARCSGVDSSPQLRINHASSAQLSSSSPLSPTPGSSVLSSRGPLDSKPARRLSFYIQDQELISGDEKEDGKNSRVNATGPTLRRTSTDPPSSWATESEFGRSSSPSKAIARSPLEAKQISRGVAVSYDSLSYNPPKEECRKDLPRSSVDGKAPSAILEELKESLKTLAKLHEAAKTFVEGRETSRLKEAPSFSLSSDDEHKISSFYNHTKITQRDQGTAPRFSLDGKETSSCVLELRQAIQAHLDGLSCPDDLYKRSPGVKAVVSTASELKPAFQKDLLNRDDTNGCRSRVPNVVARLMGLEDFPSMNRSTNATKVQQQKTSTKTWLLRELLYQETLRREPGIVPLGKHTNVQNWVAENSRAASAVSKPKTVCEKMKLRDLLHQDMLSEEHLPVQASHFERLEEQLSFPVSKETIQKIGLPVDLVSAGKSRNPDSKMNSVERQEEQLSFPVSTETIQKIGLPVNLPRGGKTTNPDSEAIRKEVLERPCNMRQDGSVILTVAPKHRMEARPVTTGEQLTRRFAHEKTRRGVNQQQATLVTILKKARHAKEMQQNKAFHGEVEKRLKYLGLQSSEYERKTLQQILEGMRLKGLLHHPQLKVIYTDRRQQCDVARNQADGIKPSHETSRAEYNMCKRQQRNLFRPQIVTRQNQPSNTSETSIVIMKPLLKSPNRTKVQPSSKDAGGQQHTSDNLESLEPRVCNTSKLSVGPRLLHRQRKENILTSQANRGQAIRQADQIEEAELKFANGKVQRFNCANRCRTTSSGEGKLLEARSKRRNKDVIKKTPNADKDSVPVAKRGSAEMFQKAVRRSLDPSTKNVKRMDVSKNASRDASASLRGETNIRRTKLGEKLKPQSNAVQNAVSSPSLIAVTGSETEVRSKVCWDQPKLEGNADLLDDTIVACNQSKSVTAKPLSVSQSDAVETCSKNDNDDGKWTEERSEEPEMYVHSSFPHWVNNASDEAAILPCKWQREAEVPKPQNKCLGQDDDSVVTFQSATDPKHTDHCSPVSVLDAHYEDDDTGYLRNDQALATGKTIKRLTYNMYTSRDSVPTVEPNVAQCHDARECFQEYGSTARPHATTVQLSNVPEYDDGSATICGEESRIHEFIELRYVQDILIASGVIEDPDRILVGGGNGKVGGPVDSNVYVKLEEKWEVDETGELTWRDRDDGGELYRKSRQEAMKRRLVFDCVNDILCGLAVRKGTRVRRRGKKGGEGVVMEVWECLQDMACGWKEEEEEVWWKWGVGDGNGEEENEMGVQLEEMVMRELVEELVMDLIKCHVSQWHFVPI